MVWFANNFFATMCFVFWQLGMQIFCHLVISIEEIEEEDTSRKDDELCWSVKVK